MKQSVLFISFFAALFLLNQQESIGQTTGQTTSEGIIPAPHQMSVGNAVTFNAETIIYTDVEHQTSASFLQELMNEFFRLELKLEILDQDENKRLNKIKNGKNAIMFLSNFSDGVQEDETVVLSIDAHKITTDHERGVVTINAHKAETSFHAVQSIVQLFPWDKVGRNSELQFPGVTIKDSPRFPWRGMLLDCSRHFMDKQFIKRYIDMLALYKMNVLHWHMTEDQGWRIQIDKYPLLTEIGAWRTEEDGSIYGGFYSKDDVREIVEYGKERFVQVVPEIEMPGHCQAALAAYPEFSCTGGPFEVETEWGVFKEIYCAGNDSTFQFLEEVLMEVIELFPSKYIHIGADEVPKFRWEHCDKCQLRMKEEGLKDGHELQSWFLKRIGSFLESKGKTMIGWDEIFEGGIPQGAIVQSWRNFDGAAQAMKAGHETIVSPTSHAYFDYPIRKINLEKVYNFPVFPEGEWSDEERKLVLGGECNMWTERAPQELVDSKVFPRLLAMSEVLWTKYKEDDTRDMSEKYNHFYQRVQSHYPFLDLLGVTYGAEAVSAEMALTKSQQGLKFSIVPQRSDLIFKYQSMSNTSDRRDEELDPETEPLTWPGDIDCLYEGAFELQAYRNDRSYGEPLEVQIFPHEAYDARILLESEYSEYYTGGGNKALVDGFGGTLDFRDGYWQAYQKSNLLAEIDLEREVNVEELKTNFYQYNNAWIFLPTEVCYSLKDKDKKLLRTECIQNTISPKEGGQFVESFSMEKSVKNVQYIEVSASNLGICPEWHDAAGSEAWLFVDEIIVR